MAPIEASPFIFVTVGTDHHSFDRLVRWVDEWLAIRSEPPPCLMQTGTSTPPNHAESVKYLRHEDMAEALERAVAVVTHAGPGTVMNACRRGLKPIVVPREHVRGEAVDDHQIAFARRLAEQGKVAVAETPRRLWQLLDGAIHDSRNLRMAPLDVSPTPAVSRFSELANELANGSRSSGRGRAGRAVRRHDLRNATQPCRIVYIAGWGRSGSTLLDRMLGQLPEVFSLGETRDIWLRGCVENRLCGCGARFLDCKFWTEVGREAFGGWDRIDTHRLMLLRRRLDRPWTMPILGGVRLGPLTPGLLEYVEALSLLFAAIQRVSRASILVDSSKAASYALFLRSIVGPDLRVVHLVRDSRGVVYSWRKRVPRGDGAQRADDHMIQYRVSGAALRYLFYNGAAQSLATAGLPYLRIRYEEMVKDPRACLDRVLRLAGLERHDGDLQFLEPAGVLLAPNHTVDGNAVRFTRGRVPLVLDDDWRTSMRPVERAAVTVLTTPLLIRYGYLRDESGEYPARHAALPTPPSKATG